MFLVITTTKGPLHCHGPAIEPHDWSPYYSFSKQTIAWRIQHAERLKRLREGTDPGLETMQKYIPMDIHGTTAHGDVIFVM